MGCLGFVGVVSHAAHAASSRVISPSRIEYGRSASSMGRPTQVRGPVGAGAWTASGASTDATAGVERGAIVRLFTTPLCAVPRHFAIKSIAI